MRHILDLSPEEKLKFLDSFDLVLTDCDDNFIKNFKQNETFHNFEEFAKAIIIGEDENIDAVILDIDVNINVSKLVIAQQLLRNPNCLFIVGATDKYIPLKKDLNIIGPEGFCRMLKESSEKEPIILGKPGYNLGRYLIEYFHITKPERVLFIGDALLQDIGFGNTLGFQTMAVLSGATSKEDLFNYFEKSNSPGFYADALSDFKQFFKNLRIPNDTLRQMDLDS